jgi:hypothetical protein
MIVIFGTAIVSHQIAMELQTVKEENTNALVQEKTEKKEPENVSEWLTDYHKYISLQKKGLEAQGISIENHPQLKRMFEEIEKDKKTFMETPVGIREMLLDTAFARIRQKSNAKPSDQAKEAKS